ncbi:MAG: ABC transporter substrate-binding protein [Spirochaetaceae bacterium]|jgi:iron complex transport system substrate-binding protein|nr:ABC transporter substrate-binding protein [Spirochaetaceae bacterium]
MRNIFAFVIMGVLAVSVVENGFAGGSPERKTGTSGGSVVVQHRMGSVRVPYNPQNLALLDFASLDILDGLGLGGRVTGVGKASTVSYLNSYTGNNALANLGSVKEVDMEALYATRPDVIFIGGRLSSEYDNLSKIAPVFVVTIDNSIEIGYMQSFKEITRTVSSIFGLEERAEELFGGFDSRIVSLNRAAAGKTALAVMVTSGSVNTLASDRCALIFNEVGFANLASDATSSTHGDSASFELLLEKNPDFIFVIDRDAVVGRNGSATARSVTARSVIENDLVKQTSAYQNGHIVYLTPDVWYLAGGGITATDIMLKDLESGILGQ